MEKQLSLSAFLKSRRKSVKLTQESLAERSGVGLRFIRDIEQGKINLRLDKINQVLDLFGHTMAPVATKSLKENENS